jgi:dTMP kinase
MSNNDNLFVTFEGVDNSGKTTLVQAVEHACSEASYGVQTTAEPSETDVTDLISEKYPAVVQTMLFAADRYLHQDCPLYHDSTPIVDGEGSVVLCDRHMDSTLAYQIPQLVSEEDWTVEFADNWIHAIHEGWVRQPDVTVFVDTSPEVAVERSLYEDDFEDPWLQQEAYTMYQDMYNGLDDYDGFIRVNGEQPRDEMIDEGVSKLMEVIDEKIVT